MNKDEQLNCQDTHGSLTLITPGLTNRAQINSDATTFDWLLQVPDELNWGNPNSKIKVSVQFPTGQKISSIEKSRRTCIGGVANNDGIYIDVNFTSDTNSNGNTVFFELQFNSSEWNNLNFITLQTDTGSGKKKRVVAAHTKVHPSK